MRSQLLIVALLLAVASAPARADAPAALGKIVFPVTGGTPEAREHFERGLLALHSFWYDEAKAQMAAATTVDPTFAMGWWGVAMSHTKLYWRRDDLPASRAAMEKIGPVDKLSPGERAWIAAARALFGEGNILARRQAFAAALERMHADFPDDDEITTNLSVALLASLKPEDPEELAVRARAAALAMEVFQKNPRHPGAAHYIIHALDTAELAPLALPAARQYASIAPEAFHARHMPAHIFSRLGMWKEARASCQSAWEASEASSERDGLGINGKDFHSLNWTLELDFQLGRRKDADAGLKLFADQVRAGMNRSWRINYLHTVGSYLTLTGEYARVGELLAPLSAPAADPDETQGQGCGHDARLDLEKPPRSLFEQQTTLDVRIEAAARRHDLPSVKRLLAEHAGVSVKLQPYLEHQMGKEEYDKYLGRMGLYLEAWLAEAQQDDQALLAAERRIAEDADKMPLGEGDVFTGGMHEEIAQTLMRLGQAREALAEYRTVLRHHPRYARGLLGAARAAAKAGEAEVSRRYYAAASEVWAAADPDFPGLDEARKAGITATSR
jgi:tetratricopeptide (TPR) repeat protein